MSLTDLHMLLGNAFTLFVLLVALWALLQALRNQPLGSDFWGAVVIGELLMVVQGALGAILYFSGQMPARMVTQPDFSPKSTSSQVSAAHSPMRIPVWSSICKIVVSRRGWGESAATRSKALTWVSLSALGASGGWCQQQDEMPPNHRIKMSPVHRLENPLWMVSFKLLR